MRLFTTSAMGLGISSGAGKRDSREQSNFRARLLSNYQSTDSTGKFIWCSILRVQLRKSPQLQSFIFYFYFFFLYRHRIQWMPFSERSDLPSSSRLATA